MSPRRKPSLGRRLVTFVTTLACLALLAIVNRPMVAFGQEQYHQFTINQQSYKSEYGHWSMLPVPDGFKVNAIHAALLPTGKVLIIAGSGNKEKEFKAGTFKTVIWDPATDTWKLITTPTDIFCAGHAFLPNGNLLVAGGTKKYEVLADKVKRAAGPLLLKNESPEVGPLTIRKGTLVTSATGVVFRTTEDAKVPPATKATVGGKFVITAGTADVWIEAVEEGKASVISAPAQFTVSGLTGEAAKNIYGIAEKLTLEKQEYGGDDSSYEFDPYQEKYIRVGNLNKHRWYPTLVPTADDQIVAVSGLDRFGRIDPGDTEVYDAKARRWVLKPQLNRYFPTYPALFLTADKRLFFSGSNAGYGPHDEGRTPGFWDLRTNTFTEVPGLRDADMTETSASLLLAPAQDQKVMILGGGEVGDKNGSTARTDIIDLDEPNPAWKPGPDLPNPARYLGAVILPDDTVFTTGGSIGYRGKGNSDILEAQIYHPDTNMFVKAASPTVGRNYHSEAMLLPDGRVITLGSDPLYDKTDKNPGTFEQRIEIYSPPYLFHGERPKITDGPRVVKRGTTVRFTTPDADSITSARLIRPSSVTHTTDVEQRSVAVTVAPQGAGNVAVTIPTGQGLVPTGWYMLFVSNNDGTPSVARWVHVQ